MVLGVALSGLFESKTMLNPVTHSIVMAVGIPMKVKAVIQKHAVTAFVTKTAVHTYCDNANLIKYEL